MKQFVKSSAIWATVWTILFLGLSIYSSIERHEPLGLLEPSTLVVFAVVWVVMFALTVFVKVLRGARRFGHRLGKEVVNNPRANAGEAIRRAAGGGAPPRGSSAPR